MKRILTLALLFTSSAWAAGGINPANLKIEASDASCERVVINIRQGTQTLSTKTFTANAAAQSHEGRKIGAKIAGASKAIGWALLTGQALNPTPGTVLSPDTLCPHQQEVFGKAESYAKSQNDKLELAKSENRLIDIKADGEVVILNAAAPVAPTVIAAQPVAGVPAQPGMAPMPMTWTPQTGSGLSPAEEQEIENFDPVKGYLSPQEYEAYLKNQRHSH